MTDLDLPPWRWDTPPRVLLDHLTGQLTAQLHGGPAYLLVHPAFGDPPGIEVEDVEPRPGALRAARESAWARPVHTLYNRDFGRHEEATFPYLVRLADAQDPLLASSIEWAVQEHLVACAQGNGAPRIGGWLQRHDDEEEDADPAPSTVAHDPAGTPLARQLTDLMRQGSKSLIRIWDRRVLHTLRIAGQGIAWDKALRGIRGWHYLDHDLRLQTLAGAEGQPGRAHLLAPGQCADVLGLCGAVHRAQYLLLRHRFPLPQDIHDTLTEKVITARRSLDYVEDQAAYAAEAVSEPAFEHWPRLPWLLGVLQRTRQEMSDALDVWRAEWAGKPADHWRAQA